MLVLQDQISEDKENLKNKRRALPFSWLENSLLALETLLPMSASERKLDFLVWWRCFRSSVYMTFSFRSAFSWPDSIWLSVIISVGGRHWGFYPQVLAKPLKTVPVIPANSPTTCGSVPASRSSMMVPFSMHVFSSIKLCKDSVATWGLLQRSPPFSTFSSNLIHLDKKNKEINKRG